MTAYAAINRVRTETRTAYCAVCRVRLPPQHPSETCSTKHRLLDEAHWAPVAALRLSLGLAWRIAHPDRPWTPYLMEAWTIAAMDAILDGKEPPL